MQHIDVVLTIIGLVLFILIMCEANIFLTLYHDLKERAKNGYDETILKYIHLKYNNAKQALTVYSVLLLTVLLASVLLHYNPSISVDMRYLVA